MNHSKNKSRHLEIFKTKYCLKSDQLTLTRMMTDEAQGLRKPQKPKLTECRQKVHV
jgi:hypothetical protein